MEQSATGKHVLFFFFLAEETELLQDDRSGFYLLYLSGSRLHSKTM